MPGGAGEDLATGDHAAQRDGRGDASLLGLRVEPGQGHELAALVAVERGDLLIAQGHHRRGLLGGRRVGPAAVVLCSGRVGPGAVVL